MKSEVLRQGCIKQKAGSRTWLRVARIRGEEMYRVRMSRRVCGAMWSGVEAVKRSEESEHQQHG